MQRVLRFALAAVLVAASSVACVSANFRTEQDAVVDDSGVLDAAEDAPPSAVADAQPPSPTLTVSVSGTGDGTVASDPVGIACSAAAKIDDCKESYTEGATVTLTATPALGSIFAGWAGGCAGSATTCTVNLSSDQAVTAMFNTASFTLTVAASGTGSGVTASNPAGIVNCKSTSGATSGDCTESLPAGSTVTLQATASSGFFFGGWSGGGCSGTSTSCTVIVSSNLTVTPTYNPPGSKSLTVLLKGTGSATVSSTTVIGCVVTLGVVSGDCTESFASGATVTLTATSIGGSTFAGWSGGGCSGTAATCVVTLSADTTVTATFTAPSYVLAAEMSGYGAGSITSSPSGISCAILDTKVSGDCSETLLSGTSVTLTATPAAGSVFVGWSGGGCSGTATTCKVAMTSVLTVKAAFSLGSYKLTIAGDKTTTAIGTVTSTSNGINCNISVGGGSGGTCTATITGATSVTVAKGSPLSAKSTWTSTAAWTCSTADVCAFTMIADTTVTAKFY